MFKNFFPILFLIFPCWGFTQNLSVYSSQKIWKVVGDYEFSEGATYDPDLCFSSMGEPYVVYIDVTEQYHRASIKRFNGEKWLDVGTGPLSSDSAVSVSFGFTSNGILYFAYSDSTGRIFFKKLDGQEWVTITTGSVPYKTNWGELEMKISKSGQLFVAYNNIDSLDYITVKKFDGQSWTVLGDRTGCHLCSFDFVLDNDDVPHLAYVDWSDSGKANVSKFDGTDWRNVGRKNFSEGHAGYLTLKFDNDNTPYVAFSLQQEDYCPKVMMFNGSDWIYCGNIKSSLGLFTDIAFSSENVPYLTFLDGPDNHKPSVMKFNGLDWEYVGNRGFSPLGALYLKIALNQNGQPFVAFRDCYYSKCGTTVMKCEGLFYDRDFIQLTLYPNPTTGILNVVSDISIEGLISIMTLSGVGVMEQNVYQSHNTIDLSNLPSGIYLIKVIGERTIQIGKIIKF